jgi:hypothetical protein
VAKKWTKVFSTKKPRLNQLISNGDFLGFWKIRNLILNNNKHSFIQDITTIELNKAYDEAKKQETTRFR